MNVIKYELKNPYFVDVDDTLIHWNLSEYPNEDTIRFKTAKGHIATVVPNVKNINTLIKLSKMGYTVLVYSQSGIEHVKSVVSALGITDYVDAYGDKPKFYADDLDMSKWATNIWRNPKTGEELVTED